jgi:hypothetical protein
MIEWIALLTYQLGILIGQYAFQSIGITSWRQGIAEMIVQIGS